MMNIIWPHLLLLIHLTSEQRNINKALPNFGALYLLRLIIIWLALSSSRNEIKHKDNECNY